MSEYEMIPAKHVIRNCTPNYSYLAYEYAMDLYRGCNHRCIYCYARSQYYEKTEDFSKIRVKEDVLRIVRDDLMRKAKKGVILQGGVADPYNCVEKELLITRHALELLNAFQFGACIITKSDLVVRDIDILKDIQESYPAFVNFSITSADDDMGKKLEPYAATTTKRFEAIEMLSKNGIPAGVLMDPMLPYITDTEENVVEMIKKAKYYGASYIYISTQVTMADIQREYFYNEADKLFPGYRKDIRKSFTNITIVIHQKVESYGIFLLRPVKKRA